MKREDEIGGGIGGSKIRKYASLLKDILEEEPTCVVVEGSLNSNNVLGLVPLLKSYGIPFKLASPKSNSSNRGNALWIKQITNKHDHITIQSTSGHEASYYKDILSSEKVYVVKEGAAQDAALPGLLSLAQEIVQFETREAKIFDTFYIDAGTGATAIGLLAGLQLLNRTEAKTVITLIAGNAKSFKNALESHFSALSKRFNLLLDPSICNMDIVFPNTSKSFGSFNATLVAEWQKMMIELSMPVDLTYTAKHFFRVKNYLRENPEREMCLVINSSSHTACRNHNEILAPTYPKKH